MRDNYVIFDLDHTVIDSTHRQATLPDGSLDLAHWKEHSRPDMIARDSLLPLARIMRIMYKAGHYVIVCTARLLADADYQFLSDNDLKFHTMLSRGPTDMRADADMKSDLLNRFFQSEGFYNTAEARPLMFDDNQKVINRLLKEGVTMVDAIKANRNLTRNWETERAIAA